MPRTSSRGGPATRAKISHIATELFLSKGFDEVTVAQVAQAAGVSSVTVFNHFPRKEDLILDRAADAFEIIESLAPAPASEILAALEDKAYELLAERHALSGSAKASLPFLQTLAASPALIARAREIGAQLQVALQLKMESSTAPAANAGQLSSTLFAAWFIAGYAAVLVAGASDILAGSAPADVAVTQQKRLEEFFQALRHGLPQL